MSTFVAVTSLLVLATTGTSATSVRTLSALPDSLMAEYITQFQTFEEKGNTASVSKRYFNVERAGFMLQIRGVVPRIYYAAIGAMGLSVEDFMQQFPFMVDNRPYPRYPHRHRFTRGMRNESPEIRLALECTEDYQKAYLCVEVHGTVLLCGIRTHTYEMRGTQYLETSGTYTVDGPNARGPVCAQMLLAAYRGEDFIYPELGKYKGKLEGRKVEN